VTDDWADTAADFDGWVTARVPGFVRFAYLITGNREAAEDAVQTALTTACAKWSRVGSMGDRDAYVRRMIVNAHVSWWRRFSRRESPVDDVRRSTSVTDDPAHAVTHADAVWRLCGSLPARQRASVVLKFYEDLSYPEIAALLECPEATVRSHIRRALATLRQTIEQQERDDERR